MSRDLNLRKDVVNQCLELDAVYLSPPPPPPPQTHTHTHLNKTGWERVPARALSL